MSKFKVGDRVRVIKNEHYGNHPGYVGVLVLATTTSYGNKPAWVEAVQFLLKENE